MRFQSFHSGGFAIIVFCRGDVKWEETSQARQFHQGPAFAENSMDGEPMELPFN
jgi:hypothetical protein